MANYHAEGNMAGWISVAMGVLAVAGQAANVFLNLKLRNSLLEQEKKILSEVEVTYKRKDVCAAEMRALQHQE